MVNEFGSFVISLDFELFWGPRYSRTKEDYGANILGVREVIPKMVELFEEYKIRVTFATVGLLFCKNKKEIEYYTPELKPGYTNKNLSPFEGEYMSSLIETGDPYHSASDVIELLKKSHYIEIGTHTFSHFYCWEQGQNIDEFDADINAAVRIANDNGIVHRSIVFPRNYEKKDYLSVCNKYGITVYRGNPDHFFNKEMKLKDRIWRFVDTYINISGMNSYSYSEIKEGSMYNVKASRFLKPYSAKLAFMDWLKIKRIKNEMTSAAKKNKIYHLWWHPHNFGINQKENLKMLEKILSHFMKLSKKYGFKSLAMEDFAKIPFKYN